MSHRNTKKNETATLLTGIFEATSSEAEAERDAVLAKRDERQAAREEERRLEEQRRREAGRKALEAEHRRLAALERKRRALEARALIAEKRSAASPAGESGTLSVGTAANGDALPCAASEHQRESPPKNPATSDSDHQLSAFQAALDAQRAAFEALREASEPAPIQSGRPLKRTGIWLALAAALILAVSVAAVPWLGFGESESKADAFENTAVPAASLSVASPGSETRDVALARVASEPAEAMPETNKETDRDSGRSDRRDNRDDQRDDRDQSNDNSTNDFGDLDANNPLEFRGTIIH